MQGCIRVPPGRTTVMLETSEGSMLSSIKAPFECDRALQVQLVQPLLHSVKCLCVGTMTIQASWRKHIHTHTHTHTHFRIRAKQYMRIRQCLSYSLQHRQLVSSHLQLHLLCVSVQQGCKVHHHFTGICICKYDCGLLLREKYALVKQNSEQPIFYKKAVMPKLHTVQLFTQSSYFLYIIVYTKSHSDIKPVMCI